MNQDEINKIFDTVSLNYDKINNFISLGLHLHIKKSAKTKRILSYFEHHGKVEQEDDSKHWHDKYEHDLYNNV